MVDSLQDITLLEAICLLFVNAVGILLTVLAQRVSDVDVREAHRWEPKAETPYERDRLRHNRLVVTEDARYGETLRVWAHALIAVIGLFWILTPQPVNPDVVHWAVAIRVIAIVLSLLLILKTLHHLVSRWRFDRPEAANARFAYVWPAIQLAWRDMSAPSLAHRT
jgi:hypothetical protein